MLTRVLKKKKNCFLLKQSVFVQLWGNIRGQGGKGPDFHPGRSTVSSGSGVQNVQPDPGWHTPPMSYLKGLAKDLEYVDTIRYVIRKGIPALHHLTANGSMGCFHQRPRQSTARTQPCSVDSLCFICSAFYFMYIF